MPDLGGKKGEKKKRDSAAECPKHNSKIRGQLKPIRMKQPFQKEKKKKCRTEGMGNGEPQNRNRKGEEERVLSRKKKGRGNSNFLLLKLQVKHNPKVTKNFSPPQQTGSEEMPRPKVFCKVDKNCVNTGERKNAR